MKKHIVSTIVLVCFGVILSGCSKDKIDSLTKMEVTENTVMLMKDGAMQSSIVEDFDKDYYDKAELETFINDTITEYEKVNGEDTVKLESLKVSNQKATATFSFKTVNDFNSFEDKESNVLTKEEALTDERVMESLTSVDSSEEVATAEALTDKKQTIYVIVATGEDVRVEGNILYYGNGELKDTNTVKTGSEGYTVVVFE